MKKIIMTSIIFIIVIIVSLYVTVHNNNNNNNSEEKSRYEEIRESAKNAAEWHLKVSQPYCVIGDTKEKRKYSHANSSFYINNGYIKKEELLDVDGINYCDMYVVEYRYIDESNSIESYKNDCEVNYKVYIKCKDYEDKGYIDWGN